MLTHNTKHHRLCLLTSVFLASITTAGCAAEGENESLDEAGESDEFDTEDEDIIEGEDTEAIEESEEFDTDEGEFEDTDAGDTDALGEDVDFDELQAELDPSLALGDISCVTGGNTDVIYDWGCNLLGGASCYHLTPNTDYQTDYNSLENCQPYQTLKTQTASMTSTVQMTHWAAWAGPIPTTKSTCERSHIEMATYEYDQNGGQWHHRSSTDRKGTWSGSSCFFGWVLSPNTATCNSIGKCQTAHAVTARAYTSNRFWFPTAHKVYLGTYGQ